MTQEKAIELAQKGHNIFITGKPGTGKTYTISKIIDALRAKGKVVARTASTGIASTHLNGSTIHAWAGIGIKSKIETEDLFKLRNNKFSYERIVTADVLIIDEISMLHDYRFDMVDTVCSFIRYDDHPFGGLQVIVSGDFFQLPPVEKSEAKNYCFNAKVWSRADFKVCYLDKVYRQGADDYLVTILNAIRSNDIRDEHIEALDWLKGNHGNHGKAVNLFCKNVNVDILNSMELSKINSEQSIFRMVESGLDFKVQQLKKNCLAAESLILKEGAKVMHLVNDFKAGLVNGTLGEITDLSKSKDGVIGFTPYKTGGELFITKNKWEITDYNPTTRRDEIVASVSQFPFKLAWGLTVHKSQGAGFDFINLDLTDTFIENMGYVALSRATAIDGIYLKGYNRTALSVDDFIIEKDEEFKSLSSKNEKL